MRMGLAARARYAFTNSAARRVQDSVASTCKPRSLAVIQQFGQAGAGYLAERLDAN
jgi:hypothetical protein